MAQSHEEKPLGLQIPAVPRGAEIPPEPPDVAARTLSVAARLLAGASVFFFLAFAFAYFYLRSLNQDHMWKPHHVKPEQGLGAAFAACILLSALAMIVAGRQFKRGERSWTVAASAGLGFGLVAVALQCIEYTVQKFGLTDGAYASVFCAWTACYLLATLATMYWLETILATELRARREPASSEGDIKDPDRLIAPGLDAAVFFWSFLAGLGLLMYIILYLL
jgi:heme/copper-type cytochrome/quinol oxidase subunit 3